MLNQDIKKSIENQLKNSTKPIAVIATADYDPGGLFREDRGLFRANRQQLINNGYEVLDISNIKDPAILEGLLANVPDGRIKLVWFRAHGQPKEMVFSKDIILHADEVETIFKWLLSKLDPKAYFYLESCSTASLNADFTNNMLFAFGRLTMPKIDVSVVAPSQVSYDDRIDVSSNGKLSFFSRASPSITALNTAILFDRTIKEYLSQHPHLNEQDKKELLDKLKDNNRITVPGTSLILNEILNEASNFHSRALSIACLQNKIDIVKELIEELFANPNVPPTTPDAYPTIYCPLNAAMERGNTEIIDYLLGKGADVFLSYKDVTPLKFLMSLEKKDYFLFNRPLYTFLLDMFDNHIDALTKFLPDVAKAHEKEIKEFREFKAQYQNTPPTPPPPLRLRL